MPTIVSKVLLAIGCLLCIHASWLPAKAWLAQILIQHSWQESMHQTTDNKNNNHTVVKPWPWADTFPIAQLSFKRLNQHVVVLNGGDPTTLAFSVGAIAPFNEPYAIKPFVVAGHRDSHFAFLENIIMKDIISMTDKNGKSQLYQVEAIDIVDASSGQLPVLPHNSHLILITCYPFTAINSSANERYVITAKPL